MSRGARCQRRQSHLLRYRLRFNAITARRPSVSALDLAAASDAETWSAVNPWGSRPIVSDSTVDRTGAISPMQSSRNGTSTNLGPPSGVHFASHAPAPDQESAILGALHRHQVSPLVPSNVSHASSLGTGHSGQRHHTPPTTNELERLITMDRPKVPHSSTGTQAAPFAAAPANPKSSKLPPRRGLDLRHMKDNAARHAEQQNLVNRLMGKGRSYGTAAELRPVAKYKAVPYESGQNTSFAMNESQWKIQDELAQVYAENKYTPHAIIH